MTDETKPKPDARPKSYSSRLRSACVRNRIRGHIGSFAFPS